MSRRVIASCFAALALAACADLENPPVTRSVVLVDEETESLARRACMPCHSHETDWQWYAQVPGVQMALAADVAAAREHLNFSTWDQPQENLDDVAEKVRSREMPPPIFFTTHPEANLSDEERERLIAGLLASFAADPPPNDGDTDGDKDDDDDDDDDGND
jgi:hypothetical protein